MSQFYRSTNFNYSAIHHQSPLPSFDNRPLNKTFAPQSTQIHRLFSPTSQQSVKIIPQPPKPYQPSASSQYIHHQPSIKKSSLHEKQQNNLKNESLNQILIETTKSFMTEMAKSIAEITKAQVQAILKEKQSQKKIFDQNKMSQKILNVGENQQKKSISQSKELSVQQTKKNKLSNGLEKLLGLDVLQQPHKNPSRLSVKSNPINQNLNIQKSKLEKENLQGELREMIKEIRGLKENRKESRSLWLDIGLQKVTETNKKDRIHQLKTRVFQIMEEVLSVGFNMHYKQGVQFDKVKAYCCENFILNYCKLVRMAAITHKEMKILEDQLQEQVLPYLNLSYPRSEQKLSSKQLKNKISEKDIFNENRFDIVYNSKVLVSTKQSETNSQIMMIMNYIMKLPDEIISETPPSQLGIFQFLNREDEKTLYQHFERDMEAILRKVYKKDLTHSLYKLNAKQQNQIILNMENKTCSTTSQLIRRLDEEILNPNQKGDHEAEKVVDVVSKFLLDSLKPDPAKQKAYRKQQEKQHKQRQQQEQQYKEKVQSYTKFKIGRKISANVEPYTEEEIQEGVLFIKDSAVARVLMKWVEALQVQIKDPVKSLYLRDEPFRLHNSQETYVLSTEDKVKELYQFYKRSAKVIQEKSQDIKNNARKIFLEAIKSSQQERFKCYREFSSQNDALVGHISTVLLKSRENHISSYLNMILGEIKYIEQEYQWKIEDKKIDLTSGPSLINMKLGDLMRCQIISKPKEIIALYQYISLLCKTDPRRFQMVRVKDRSSTPNKDILINIFYHQKIMIEIQLAIKNESAFISCSDRFSHFIYQLERAFLGPINQVCSLWSMYSPKSQFFIRKFNELNIRAKPPLRGSNECLHLFEDQQKYLKLPFTCFSCGVLYYNSSTLRKQCSHCKVYECCICHIKSNQLGFVERQFPDYEIKRERNVGEIFYALEILTNSKYIKTMLKVEINGKLEAYSMKIESSNDKKNPQPIVSNIKSQYQISQRWKLNSKRSIFEQSHIILQKKSEAKRKQDNKMVGQVIKQILNVYYLPRRTRVIINKSQSIMKLTLITNPIINSSTKGEIITNIIHKNNKMLGLIEKLNLNQNGLTDLKIGGKIPNARNVVLNHNQLSNLDLFGFKNLVTLELAHNQIGSLRQLRITDCVNLKRLILDDNQILSLEGLPAELVLLQCLSLSKNKIKFLKGLPYYKQIKTLNLNQNELMDLIGIQKLTTLEELTIRDNTTLANSGIEFLRDLKLLKKLDLNKINLRKALMQTYLLHKDCSVDKNYSTDSLQHQPLFAIKNLTQLECLDASSNGLIMIPKIPQLSKLKELNLSKNQINDIQNLSNFLHLKWLCLRGNQITEIKSLASLRNLNWLDLSKNHITSKELVYISELKNLHQIELSHNKLVSLEGIGSLPKLYQLSCKSNRLSSLKGLEKLVSLQHLDARNNGQIFEITGLDNLKVLFELKLSGNKIINLNSLKKVQSLKILQLNNCQLNKIKIIPPLKNLQELYLNRNKIQKMEGISNFSSLKKLEITENDMTISGRDLEGLNNLSYISFSLTSKVELEYITNALSLQVIKIHQLQEPTKKQSNDLVALSLLGYNIRFFQPEPQTPEESLNVSELY